MMPIQIRVVVPFATVSDYLDENDHESPDDDFDPNNNIKKCESAGTHTSRDALALNDEIHNLDDKRCKPIRKRFSRPYSAHVNTWNVSNKLQIPGRPHDVTMHVASTYDIQNEHVCIMDQALRADTRHRYTGDKVVGKGAEHLGKPHRFQNAGGLEDCDGSKPSSLNGVSTNPCPAATTPATVAPKRIQFRLSLCTLKDAVGQELVPLSYTHPSPRLRIQRPRSAGRVASTEVSVASNTAQNCSASVKPGGKPQDLKLFSIPFPSTKMDAPISRSTAYQIRNRTTHSWADNSNQRNHHSDPMTMSCPNAQTLEEHLRFARSHVPRDPNPSPVVVKARSISSPSSSPQENRPSSAYSYDGGFFLNPPGSSKESFIIHPDWVSEAMSVQKLSLGERHLRSRQTGSALAGRGSFSGEDTVNGEVEKRRSRRCKSAPPPKRRNPITWAS